MAARVKWLRDNYPTQEKLDAFVAELQRKFDLAMATMNQLATKLADSKALNGNYDDLEKDFDSLLEALPEEYLDLLNGVLDQGPELAGYITGALLYEAFEAAVVAGVTVGTASAASAAKTNAKIMALFAKIQKFGKAAGFKHWDEIASVGEAVLKHGDDANGVNKAANAGDTAKDLKTAANQGKPDLPHKDGPEIPHHVNLGCFVAGTGVWLSAVPATVLVGATSLDAEMTGGQAASREPWQDTRDELWNIESVPLGARVDSRNPRSEDYDFSFANPEQATWRKVSLTHEHPSGMRVNMELLRPLSWVVEHRLEVGRSLATSIPDMQLKGRATVTEISDCPPIAAGEGAVVTGRFVTLRVNRLIRLTMTGDVELVGTPSHPIWSEDRQDWVPMGELVAGEKLRSRSGIVRAEQLEVLDEEASVYNIEVHGQHVYEVTPLGILVHNPDADCVRWKELREKQASSKLTTAEDAELKQLTDTLIDRRRDGTLSPKEMKKSGLSKEEIEEIRIGAQDSRPKHFDIHKIAEEVKGSEQTVKDLTNRLALDPSNVSLAEELRDAELHLKGLKKAQADYFRASRKARRSIE